MKMSRLGNLMELMEHSGIAGNPVISDSELRELSIGLRLYQNTAIDWGDKPLVEVLARQMESVDRMIAARKTK